tara:strand:+ start:1494 stop:1697 length:204 start_codon:yes stop_codon:yes gene_type:complete
MSDHFERRFFSTCRSQKGEKSVLAIDALIPKRFKNEDLTSLPSVYLVLSLVLVTAGGNHQTKKPKMK